MKTSFSAVEAYGERSCLSIEILPQNMGQGRTVMEKQIQNRRNRYHREASGFFLRVALGAVYEREMKASTRKYLVITSKKRGRPLLLNVVWDIRRRD